MSEEQKELLWFDNLPSIIHKSLTWDELGYIVDAKQALKEKFEREKLNQTQGDK